MVADGTDTGKMLNSKCVIMETDKVFKRVAQAEALLTAAVIFTEFRRHRGISGEHWRARKW